MRLVLALALALGLLGSLTACSLADQITGSPVPYCSNTFDPPGYPDPHPGPVANLDHPCTTQELALYNHLRSPVDGWWCWGGGAIPDPHASPYVLGSGADRPCTVNELVMASHIPMPTIAP